MLMVMTKWRHCAHRHSHTTRFRVVALLRSTLTLVAKHDLCSNLDASNVVLLAAAQELPGIATAILSLRQYLSHEILHSLKGADGRVPPWRECSSKNRVGVGAEARRNPPPLDFISRDFDIFRRHCLKTSPPPILAHIGGILYTRRTPCGCYFKEASRLLDQY